MAPVADGGLEASKRMHEYLLSKQRRQEEFWLRKYGKVLQQPPPSVGRPAPNPRLPPLGGSASGQGSASSRGSYGGGGLSADPSSNTLPPLPSATAAAGGGGIGAPAGLPPPHHHRQPKGHAPIFHAQEPVKDFFTRNARQPRASGSTAAVAASRDDLGSALPPSHRPPEPYRRAPPSQLPPMAGGYAQQQLQQRLPTSEHSFEYQQQQHPRSLSPRQNDYGRASATGDGSGYNQQPTYQLHNQHHSPSPRSGGGGGGAPSRRLPPLPPEPSSARSPTSGGGGGGNGGKPLRNLEMELAVIRAIKAREDVLERLRVAAGKLDAGFGGTAPVVLAPVDPLVRLFYRLVGTLRQRTLDVIESIAAWRRKVNPTDPFIYFGVDYLAAIGPDVGFMDELPFLRTRLTFGKAADDPFLAEVTPDGIPIEEATTCDLRRDLADDLPPAKPKSPRPYRTPDHRTWADRQDRQEAAWVAQSPELQGLLLQHAATHAQIKVEVSTHLLGLAQARLDGLASMWRTNHTCGHPQHPGGDMEGQYQQELASTIRYIGLLSAGPLQIPAVTCKCCLQRYVPHPVEAGCFPSSPVDPHAWYDLHVHEAYCQLGLEGLSATDFAEYVGVSTGEHVDDRQFLGSFFAFLRTSNSVDSLEALGVEGMDTGPFADCPICAMPPRPPEGPETVHVEAPEPQPPYPLAVSLDAVTKLGHYASCGTGSGDPPAHLNRYFGPVDTQVSSAHLAGKLDLRSTIEDPTMDGIALDGVAACASSLHCARPDAPSASGPCDIHGVCGAVCMHTVPLRSVFCDMRTPEQFAYYLIMLGHITQQRPDLKHVYIDFGCRIAGTWKRYVAKHSELPPEAAELEIMVNWMHGNGHDLACQLTNSGRYKKGAGRRIGEEIEQLWSGTKPVSGLVRYMTKARRRDFIEAVLRSLSRKKFKKMVKLLEKKYRDTVKLMSEGETAVAKAIDTAACAGVADLPAAAAEYVQSVVPAGNDAAQPDKAAWEVEYALLRLRYMELRALQGKAPALAVVSSASAVALAAASTDAQVNKVRAALDKVEMARGLGPFERGKWKPGYPPFDAAVQRLKEREVQRCQARVETLVLELHQTHAERELAGATDKDAKRSQARARRKRAQIRSQLEEMYVWQSVGGGVVVRLTEQQVKQLFVPGEQAPWCTPSSGAAAVRRHHGRLFHEASAALSRSREEEGFLRYEKFRLGIWLRRAALCVEAARQKKLGVCPGSVFLLDGHRRAMDALQSELAASSIPGL